jgi:hypothetical protein
VGHTGHQALQHIAAVEQQADQILIDGNLLLAQPIGHVAVTRSAACG